MCSATQMPSLHAQQWPSESHTVQTEGNSQCMMYMMVPVSMVQPMVFDCMVPSQFQLAASPYAVGSLQSGSSGLALQSDFGPCSIGGCEACPATWPSTPTTSGQAWSEHQSCADSDEWSSHQSTTVSHASRISERALHGDQEEFGEALSALLEPGVVRHLSFQRAGCLKVQLALERATRSQAALLAAQLQGSVVEAIKSPHANHVIQKIISVSTFSEVPFLVQELVDSGEYLQLAAHEFGCRIYSRLLEHSMQDERLATLMDRVLWEAGWLSRDMYGHHVVESALEHGLNRHRSRIVSALRQHLPQYALNRNGAYVLEKALYFGTQEHKEALAWDLLESARVDMVELASLNLGRSRGALVLAVLKVSEEAKEVLQAQLTTPEAEHQLAAGKQSQVMRKTLAALRTTESSIESMSH